MIGARLRLLAVLMLLAALLPRPDSGSVGSDVAPVGPSCQDEAGGKLTLVAEGTDELDDVRAFWLIVVGESSVERGVWPMRGSPDGDPEIATAFEAWGGRDWWVFAGAEGLRDAPDSVDDQDRPFREDLVWVADFGRFSTDFGSDKRSVSARWSQAETRHIDALPDQPWRWNSTVGSTDVETGRSWRRTVELVLHSTGEGS